MRDSNKSSHGRAPTSLSEAPVVLVSACLLGAACRHDGGSRGAARLLEVLEGKAVVPICPEAGAGLGVPRAAVQLTGGAGSQVWSGEARAVTVEGAEERTAAFKRGAALALEAAQGHGARLAVLKERSPSCGSATVYVDGALVPGEGITTALLRAHGVTVVGESEL